MAISAPVSAQQTSLGQIFGRLLNTPQAATANGGGSTNSNGSYGAGSWVAAITPAQEAQIDKLLAAPNPDPRIRADLQAAEPLIKKILATEACAQNGAAMLSLNKFSLNPQSHFDFAFLMHWMEYHNKRSCLDVMRIFAWGKPANNALSFSVNYIAEDSGETGSQNFILQNTEENGWMIKSMPN